MLRYGGANCAEAAHNSSPQRDWRCDNLIARRVLLFPNEVAVFTRCDVAKGLWFQSGVFRTGKVDFRVRSTAECDGEKAKALLHLLGDLDSNTALVVQHHERSAEFVQALDFCLARLSFNGTLPRTRRETSGRNGSRHEHKQGHPILWICNGKRENR